VRNLKVFTVKFRIEAKDPDQEIYQHLFCYYCYFSGTDNHFIMCKGKPLTMDLPFFLSKGLTYIFNSRDVLRCSFYLYVRSAYGRIRNYASVYILMEQSASGCIEESNASKE
jgi:hypothetical protein